MNTITILVMLAFFSGVATLSISEFIVINTVTAQMPGDNAIISGNTTGGNATGGNAIGLIPHVDTPSGPDRGGH